MPCTAPSASATPFAHSARRYAHNRAHSARLSRSIRGLSEVYQNSIRGLSVYQRSIADLSEFYQRSITGLSVYQRSIRGLSRARWCTDTAHAAFLFLHRTMSLVQSHGLDDELDAAVCRNLDLLARTRVQTRCRPVVSMPWTSTKRKGKHTEAV